MVTTEYPTERIVSRYSGPLEEIYVKNGDTVKIGQPLAIFRNTAHTKDIKKLKEILEVIKPNLGEFSFPMDSTSYLVLGDVETAYINFEKSYLDYHLLKDLDPYTNQLYGSRQTIIEIKLRLKNQITQRKVLEQEYNLMKRDFERYQQLFEKGVISQQEFELKKMEFLRMDRNLGDMALSISQMREAILSASQNLKATRIDQQEDNTRFMVNLLQASNALKKSIGDWEHTYLLKSSIEGIIGFQKFWGANQFINSGEVVFSILPTDTSRLVGKLTVPSQNIGKVMVGQKVLIKLNNFPYQQYGMLAGEVMNISVSPDVDGNYFVYITLPNGTKTSYNKKLPFEQELIGNAEIITEDLSIAERLFYKFRELFKYE
ncbi:HlyD family secretion protein [Maribacter sp.]